MEKLPSRRYLPLSPEKLPQKKLSNFAEILSPESSLIGSACVLQVCSVLKVRQSRNKLWFPQFFQKRTKLIILSWEDAQNSEFRSFFGRIEETIKCFWDLLTFKTKWAKSGRGLAWAWPVWSWKAKKTTPTSNHKIAFSLL